MKDTGETASRGFFSEEGQDYYLTRNSERINLSEEEARVLKVFEDFMNRLLFLNTMDLKRAIVASAKKPAPRPYKKRSPYDPAGSRREYKPRNDNRGGGGRGPYKPRGYGRR